MSAVHGGALVYAPTEVQAPAGQEPVLLANGSCPPHIWAKVNQTETCWLWTGGRSKGYGMAVPYGRNGPNVSIHRYIYELFRGPIPVGLVLDHLCRVRHCVNPEHLEPVTIAENVRRGLKGRMVTHCPKGHEYTPENTYTYNRRECRRCKIDRISVSRDAAYWRAYRAKRKAAAA